MADVDPVTLLLTPEAVEQVRTPRTKAVIPVHLYGHVVPFDSIDSWKDDGLVVIEDAAQAHLATWNNEYVGSHGDAACFSFYPGKNLGALGDGGMVVSREPDVIDRIKKLRDHGRTSKFEHEVPGWCSRLDAIQAAVLRVKLRHLGGWTARRRLLAEIYSSALGAYLVPWSVGAVHHLIVGRFGDPGLISDSLRQGNVGSGRHYPKSLSKHPWLAEGTHTPIADSAAGQLLSLPIDPLMSDNDVERVCHLVEANEIGGTRARPAVPE